MVLRWFRLGAWWLAVVVGAAAAEAGDSAEARLGERLFADERFAQYFHATTHGNVNAPLRSADPALRAAARRLAGSEESPANAISCRVCHFTGGDAGDEGGATARRAAFSDLSQRSAITRRGDRRTTMPRNSPSLLGALEGPGPALLHFDGEFATPESLVRETFIGRSFGWLPEERADAIRHVATVLREDDGARSASAGSGRAGRALSYSTLLRGTALEIPEAWRLPEMRRLDPASATDDALLEVAARCVVAFLHTLRFSRDEAGLHNGSPYDAFLAVNRIPRAPSSGQSPAEYGRRVGEQLAALRSPRFVDEPARASRTPAQPFRFGELELAGLRVFFRGAISPTQRSGAGNCAECHVPPHFADFALHNTGAAEEEYDALHGAGTFRQLRVPRLDARDSDHDRWLPPTPSHPAAKGPFLFPAAKEIPDYTDLGVWNVYANPDFPAVQMALERILNPSGRWSRGDVLDRSIGRFKTPGLRNLGDSAPYLHTGRAATLEDTVRFYERMSALAHAGEMRNAPPEFHAMRLGAEDVGPLAAFLRALNEDIGERRATPGSR